LHIGVLQALLEEGIVIDYISGCSSGSIIAAMHAMEYTPIQMLYIFNKYCNNISDYDKLIPFKIFGMIFTGKLKLKGLVKGKNLERIINKFCLNKNIVDISEIKLPIAIPTVNLQTGEIIYYTNKTIYSRSSFDDEPTYLSRGKLSSIIRASCSFPGVFEPKYLNGNYLIDGGVRMNCPVSVLNKLGAKRVLAITFDDNKLLKDFNVISVTKKTFDIMGHEINLNETNKANLVLKAKIKDDISLLDCKQTRYIANIGYELIKKNIDEIKKLIY
jgi:NTE family protein